MSDYDKDPCIHGHINQHVVRALSSEKFIGCYGGTPTDESRADFADTQIRSNPHPTEVDGANVGLARSGSHRDTALHVIFDEFGATSDRISQYMDERLHIYVPPNQVASRVGELVKGGWVQESGEVALTRRGGEAIVWRYYEHLGRKRADLPD
jgi:hypothetical protein